MGYIRIKKGQEGGLYLLMGLLALGWFIWFLTLPLVKDSKHQGTHLGNIEYIDSKPGNYGMTTIHLSINGDSEAKKYDATIRMRTMEFNSITPSLVSGTKVAVEIKEYTLADSKPWCILGLKSQDQPQQTILKVSPGTYGISGIFEKFNECDEVLLTSKPAN